MVDFIFSIFCYKAFTSTFWEYLDFVYEEQVEYLFFNVSELEQNNFIFFFSSSLKLLYLLALFLKSKVLLTSADSFCFKFIVFYRNCRKYGFVYLESCCIFLDYLSPRLQEFGHFFYFSFKFLLIYSKGIKNGSSGHFILSLTVVLVSV